MSDGERAASLRSTLAAQWAVAGLATASVAGVALGTGSVAGTLVAAGAAAVVAGALLGRSTSRVARAAGSEARERERVLLAIIDGAPMAIVLHADSGRIAFTNAAARELFFEGRAVEGESFLSLLPAAPVSLREALLAPGDGLFTVEQGGESDTYHLARRTFDLGGEPHTLLVVKVLTEELSRQEAEVWKKVIRVMSHELNNSLAPIASLVHSARVLAAQPEPAARLERVFSVIEERTRHLHGFLEGYAKLARLPRPRPAVVRWEAFLGGLRALFPDVRWGATPAAPAWLDPAQMEQVAINLLRNAVEAGSPPADVSVEVTEEDGGFRLSVLDRGRGLSAEVLENALLPFYSTKEKGSGLGLALCREVVEGHGGRLRLANREGGGAVVSVWLPGQHGGRAGSASRARITLTRG